MLDALAADVSAALSGQLRPAELRRNVYAPALDDTGNQVVVSMLTYPCEATRHDYSAVVAGASNIPRETTRIEILAASLDGIEPARRDVIVMIGEPEEWRIVEIERDAAGVLYVCQCT